MSIRLEICVDSLDDAWAAVEAGADRIELCAALPLGGLTPSPGAMAEAAALPVPVYAMIRPRAGDYVFGTRAKSVMERDIETCRHAGLAGVVLGASRSDGRLDLEALRQLCAAAIGLGTTLHRAFDVTPDPFEALEQAVELGFERILSSGQASRAVDGAPLLAQLAERAASRIGVMAGCGVTAATIDALLERAPLAEVHASCKTTDPGAFAPLARRLPADTEFGRSRTDPAGVRALRARLDRRRST